jgi:hypothetical protein
MKKHAHAPATFVLVSGLVALAVAGCDNKEKQKELDKKAEQLGEDIGATVVVDMTKKQLAAARAKHAKGESPTDDCSGLLSVRTDVAKDTKLVQEISSFCLVEVAHAQRVATIKKDYAAMVSARKEKDRSSEQMAWASFRVTCESIKGDFAGLKADKVDTDPKAKALEAEVGTMCTPENVARKKYFT